MVTVRIGNAPERSIDDLDPSWINQQINRRRDDGTPVCVTIDINDGPRRMRLATCDCPRGPGSRAPNQFESEIFALWEKHGLNDCSFTGGQLVAFLKQLNRVL
jgi:hypothetical protein